MVYPDIAWPHAADFGALGTLQRGETMWFANDHDLLPRLSHITQRCCNPIGMAYRLCEPGAIVIDLSVPMGGQLKPRAAPSFP